jgi:hypothetical protein
MEAIITLVTNAEGTHRIDLEDITIQGDGILEYLIHYLFDDEEGLHKDLPDESRELREQALRETTFIIESVEDDEGLVERFFKKTEDGINTFNLSGYAEVTDIIDSTNNSAKIEPVVAYIIWAGEWSLSDFESTYEGEFPNDLAFVQSHTEMDDVPDWVRPYFDWDQYVNDEMANYTEQDGFYFSCM